MDNYRNCETIKSKPLGKFVVSNSIAKKYRIIKDVSKDKSQSVFHTECEGVQYIVKLSKNEMKRESICEILSSIESPYVMSIKEYGSERDYFYEVYPYCDQGSLRCVSDEKELKEIINCVNEGLKVLHDAHIIHGDIKPENLYWSDDRDRVMIGDFDISVIEDSDEAKVSTEYSLEYYPVRGHAFSKSRATDYASFGITVLDLYFGTTHFQGKEIDEIEWEWKEGIQINGKISANLSGVISGLTQYEESNRYGYREVRLWCNDQIIVPRTADRIVPKVEKGTFAITLVIEGGSAIRAESLEELAIKIEHNWEAVKRRFFGSTEKATLLIEFINQFDTEKGNAIRDIIKTKDPDSAITALLMVLDDSKKIVIKGKGYGSIGEFARSMNPKELDRDYVDFIRKGLLETCLKNNGQQNVWEEVQKLISFADSNDELMYFLIYQFFSGDQCIYVNNIKITDLEEFAQYLCNYGWGDVEKLSMNYIYAWLFAKGYANEVKKMWEACTYDE